MNSVPAWISVDVQIYQWEPGSLQVYVKHLLNVGEGNASFDVSAMSDSCALSLRCADVNS